MNTIKNLFANYDHPMVLDVATGKGGFLPAILEMTGDNYKQIMGVDPSDEALTFAKKSFSGKNILFQQADAENLPFDDKTFQIITMSNALHHVENISKTLAELQRVKSKKGIIYISEMFRDNQNEQAETFLQFHDLKSQTDRLKGERHHDVFRKDEIINFIKEFGLKIVQQAENESSSSPFPDDEEFMKRIDTILPGLEKENCIKEYQAKIQTLLERYEKTGMKKPTTIDLILQ